VFTSAKKEQPLVQGVGGKKAGRKKQKPKKMSRERAQHGKRGQTKKEKNQRECSESKLRKDRKERLELDSKRDGMNSKARFKKEDNGGKKGRKLGA